MTALQPSEPPARRISSGTRDAPERRLPGETERAAECPDSAAGSLGPDRSITAPERAEDLDRGPAARTVYVVDDDLGILELVRRTCRARGWTSESFTSAEAFLEAVDPSAAGCLILDQRLPRKSGLQLLDDLRVRCPQLPVVFVSGSADVATAIEAFRAGSLDFLEKPFELAELERAIERALARDLEARSARAVRDELAGRLARLTRREREVMQLVVAGCSNREAGERLGVSPKTVEVHRSQVMRKMEAGSLPELVRMAIALGEPATG